MKPILGLVAGDIGEKQMMHTLAMAALERGAELVVVDTSMKEFSMDALQNCQAVLLGLSSREPREWPVAHMLAEKNIPFAVAEQASGGAMRPWFTEMAPHAETMFPAFPQTIDAAKDYGYGKVEYIGPPTTWQRIVTDMRDGEHMRSRILLNKGEQTQPLGREQTLLYIPGVKGRPQDMNEIIRAARSAALGIFQNPDAFALYFRGHPKEKPDDLSAEQEKIYEEAFRERTEDLLRDVWAVTADQAFSGDHYAGAADMIIFPKGAPTLSNVAPYLRKPAAYIKDPKLHDQVSELSPDQYVPYLANHLVDRVEDLEKHLRFLLTEEGQTALRQRQEELLPQEPHWNSASLYLDALERIATRK